MSRAQSLRPGGHPRAGSPALSAANPRGHPPDCSKRGWWGPCQSRQTRRITEQWPREVKRGVSVCACACVCVTPSWRVQCELVWCKGGLPDSFSWWHLLSKLVRSAWHWLSGKPPGARSGGQAEPLGQPQRLTDRGMGPRPPDGKPQFSRRPPMTRCHHRQAHSDRHTSLALCEGRKSPEAAWSLPVIHCFPPFKPNLELSRARGPLQGAHCGLESLRHLGGLVGTLRQKTANETKRKKKKKERKQNPYQLPCRPRLSNVPQAASWPLPRAERPASCWQGDGASRTVRFPLMMNEQRSLRV